MRPYLHLTLLAALLFTSPQLNAATGRDAWLRYIPVEGSARQKYDSLPASVVVLGDSAILNTAQSELVRGVRGMLGRTLRAGKGLPQEASIILGTFDQVKAAAPALHLRDNLAEDGFQLTTGRIHGFQCIIITAITGRGVLYGVFAWLSKIAQNQTVTNLDEAQQPYNRLRWVNQWDNLDGRIERGYAGRSIFFDNGTVRADLTRVGEYARLLASIGINGCSINNVNADPHILESSFLPQLSRIADSFRPWGVQLVLSVGVDFPKVIGGLDTFDPLDPRVADWWQKKLDEIYRQIPDFGGFVVKADSEGQPGPASYGALPRMPPT